MSNLIERLEQLNSKDTKVRAVLRRSLSHPPGAFVEAFPYIEPFVPKDLPASGREASYLVAGLWAAHWRAGRSSTRQTIATACATHKKRSGSESVEQRFIQLLDADQDQLAYRLRQMVALLADYPLDFSAMLWDVLRWGARRKPAQIRWARQFYRGLESEPAPATPPESEQ